jgi:hypothetical protein
VKSSRMVLLLFPIVVGFALLPYSAAAAGDGGSDRLVRGWYSSIFSGFLITPPTAQPFAGTGLFVSDGKGNLTGHETFNLNGHACQYQIKGTYSVSADGTGSNAIAYTNGGSGCPDGSYTQSLAVVGDGDLILLSNTNSPDVATEHWHRVAAREAQSGKSGACCQSAGVCLHTTAAQCMGTYLGIDTTCASNICSQ